MSWIKQPPTLTKKQELELAKQITKLSKKMKGKVKRGYTKKLIIK